MYIVGANMYIQVPICTFRC